MLTQTGVLIQVQYHTIRRSLKLTDDGVSYPPQIAADIVRHCHTAFKTMLQEHADTEFRDFDATAYTTTYMRVCLRGFTKFALDVPQIAK